MSTFLIWQVTLNFYLNDLSAAQRGRTFFYGARDAPPADAAGGEAGSVAIFEQETVRHSGEPLAAHGLKYLLRTDVVYQLQE